jgi:hypothetical protein
MRNNPLGALMYAGPTSLIRRNEYRLIEVLRRHP